MIPLLYVTGRNLRYLKAELQHDLSNVSKWLLNNKQVLNVTKTKSMLFTPRNSVVYESISLQMHGEVIENREKFKFLGVWLDHHLEWDHYIKVVTNKIVQNCYVLKRLSSYVSKDILHKVYYAHINSHLVYGIFVGGSMLTESQLTKLMKAQKVALNILNSEKILNMKQIICLELGKFMYKLIKYVCTKK